MKDYFKTVPNLESLTGTYSKARDFLSFNMGNIKRPSDQEVIKNYSSQEFPIRRLPWTLNKRKRMFKRSIQFLKSKDW